MSWLKIKCYEEADFEVLGVLREPGTAPLALMASHDAERRYVGTAIVAIRGNIRDWFWRRVEEMPGPPPKGLKKPATQWVAPGLIGRVRYLKGEEHLRHATLKDVRDDG